MSNMKLVIDECEYELILINQRKFVFYNEIKHFDGVEYHGAYLFNSIVIDNQFYAPRLIQKDE